MELWFPCQSRVLFACWKENLWRADTKWGIDWPLTCSLPYCSFLNSLGSFMDVALIFCFCLWYSAFYSKDSTCGFIFYFFCSWYRELHHISLVMENTLILFFNNDIFCSFYSRLELQFDLFGISHLSLWVSLVIFMVFFMISLSELWSIPSNLFSISLILFVGNSISNYHMYVHVCCSIIFNSLRPHGL